MSSYRERQKEKTRDRLFETATKMFMAKGFEETSVADVTKAAGVAKGTFFVHFPTKASILGEHGRRQMDHVLEMIEGAERFDTWPFRRQLDHIFRTLARAVDGDAELAKLVLLQGEDPTGDFEQRFVEILKGVVKNGQRRGYLRADVAADRIAEYLFGVYESAKKQWASSGGNFERRLVEALDLSLGGLNTRR